MRSSATRWKRRFVSVLQLTDIETRGDLPQGKRLENSSEQDFFSFLFFVLGLSLIFCFLCNVFMGPPPPLRSLLSSSASEIDRVNFQPNPLKLLNCCPQPSHYLIAVIDAWNYGFSPLPRIKSTTSAWLDCVTQLPLT